MSEIKPVYQVQTYEGRNWEDCEKDFYESVLKNNAQLSELRILYPAAAYEALQKELELEKMMAVGYVARGDRLEAENEAQSKRIEEQQEENLKQKDLILNFQDQYAKDHAEIESLRKQVKLHKETQSNELIKLREAGQFLEDKQREVTEILLLNIDPFEIIKRAGSALSASKNGE